MNIYLDESYNLQKSKGKQFISIKSIRLLGRHDIAVLSVFQIIQEIDKSKKYFFEDKIDFEKVYSELVKSLLLEINIAEYKLVRIIIDSRKHRGGVIGEQIL